MNPYHIEGPAVVSFSGGRTSGYMLRKILDVGLQPDVHVVFANTGKERIETLDFIHECETRWAVPIVWLEFEATSEGTGGLKAWQEVDYASAKRHGEPFQSLLDIRGNKLPYPVGRWCTQELKIRPMVGWMRSRGYERFENAVGIRGDEPSRVTRMRGHGDTLQYDIALPLADAGVTEPDVMAFWSVQPFDLQIRQAEGNCDLCFLKSYPKLKNIIRDRPDLAVWWAAQEERTGDRFRRDRPSYQGMLDQPDLFKEAYDDGDIIECACTD
jgi:3'-phosphoadenosine 5'-phosphosulfate sulfotransferase (PAPS reductase)/FAD synthetase